MATARGAGSCSAFRLPPALLFFRDRKGTQVDLLVERGEVVVALEAKGWPS